jgi:uroporphyrinogen-III synthase
MLQRGHLEESLTACGFEVENLESYRKSNDDEEATEWNKEKFNGNQAAAAVASKD